MLATPRRLRFRHGYAVAIYAWSSLAFAQAEPPLALPLEMKPWTGDLDGMIERRTLRVLVPYNRTLYFVDLQGSQRGMSYDFMSAFEAHLNKKLKLGRLRLNAVFIPVARNELLPWLIDGRGDVAAANLTITPQRLRQVDFTIPLARNIREVIVTGPEAPALTKLEDLSGQQVFVQRDTSYYESLVALNSSLTSRKLPPVKLIHAPGHFETEDILEMVNAGLVKIAVADDYLANLWKQAYANLRVHELLTLRTDGEVAFAFRKQSPKLAAELNAFAKTHRQGTTFGNVTINKYVQQTRWIKNATSKAELKRVGTLVGLFQKYGTRYHIDWLLMTAQGYQESQLDQSRRSPVGAIGVMQVMPATGKQMRVGDITQLEPNIHAGIKYTRHVIDEYFNEPAIDELNKVLFTFAAYNAGPTRIQSLRRVTAKRGLNPNIWFNNVELVVAQNVGREPVQYVSNIYKYYVAYSLSQEMIREDLPKPK